MKLPTATAFAIVLASHATTASAHGAVIRGPHGGWHAVAYDHDPRGRVDAVHIGPRGVTTVNRIDDRSGPHDLLVRGPRGGVTYVERDRWCQRPSGRFVRC